MTPLDALVLAVVSLAVWGAVRMFLAIQEVIPGVNEPPQGGWHPPMMEGSDGTWRPMSSPFQGILWAALLSGCGWGLIYLLFRALT